MNPNSLPFRPAPRQTDSDRDSPKPPSSSPRAPAPAPAPHPPTWNAVNNPSVPTQQHWVNNPQAYYNTSPQPHYQWVQWAQYMQQWAQWAQFIQPGYTPFQYGQPLSQHDYQYHSQDIGGQQPQYGTLGIKHRYKSNRNAHSQYRAANNLSAQSPGAGVKRNENANTKKIDKYGTLHLVRPYNSQSWRVNKQRRETSVPIESKQSKKDKQGRGGKKDRDPKIMLPAPKPTPEYLAEATKEPYTITPPTRQLVILDLNGTLIYRPNRKNPTSMIARPFLKPFLSYLFENFAVMVWSSARPQNVNVLVDNVLDNDLKSMLVDQWARDTFGLSNEHYNQNVQVYKNLNLVWEKEHIHESLSGHAQGKRFGQHNTILIDDSSLKASAQPYNLIEIPEFKASAEDMKGDVLREVTGYLEVLKVQADVSRFMRKDPFKADGRWMYEWTDDVAEGGTLDQKVSRKDEKQEEHKN